MKLLHVVRSQISETNEDVQKLRAIVSEGRENVEFKLYDENPDYSKLVDMVFEADQTICWW
ncbi:MAG: hypothetical protein ACOY3Z_12610 [Thermodesulfobacteriota bacterium]